MPYKDLLMTLRGHYANSARKVELHAGYLRDLNRDTTVEGFVIQAGTSVLALTDEQAQGLLQLLAGHYAREHYERLVNDAKWGALLETISMKVVSTR